MSLFAYLLGLLDFLEKLPYSSFSTCTFTAGVPSHKTSQPSTYWRVGQWWAWAAFGSLTSSWGRSEEPMICVPCCCHFSSLWGSFRRLTSGTMGLSLLSLPYVKWFLNVWSHFLHSSHSRSYQANKSLQTACLLPPSLPLTWSESLFLPE